MDDNYFFEINPKIEDLEDIEKWLKDEYNEQGESFFSNFSIIKNSFEEKRLIVCKLNGASFGFIVWRKDNVILDLDIMAIKYSSRDKGFGSRFLNDFIDFAIKMGVFVVMLFCSPTSSERFWKKMEFIKFPENCVNHNLSYYKILINHLEPKSCVDKSNKIELWDVEPHQINKSIPKWKWCFDKNIELPIFHPSNGDWNIRLTKNGVIIKDEKVKYFNRKDGIFDNCPFIFIQKLEEDTI